MIIKVLKRLKARAYHFCVVLSFIAIHWMAESQAAMDKGYGAILKRKIGRNGPCPCGSGKK
jgi:uncharacterized protein YecA (UPF0149 family)